MFDEICQRGNTQRWRRRHAQEILNHEGDRREIALRIIWESAVQQRVDCKRAVGREQQRMPVLRLPHPLRREYVVRTGAVLYDDCLVPAFGERVGQSSRHCIRGAAGRHQS